MNTGVHLMLFATWPTLPGSRRKSNVIGVWRKLKLGITVVHMTIISITARAMQNIWIMKRWAGVNCNED